MLQAPLIHRSTAPIGERLWRVATAALCDVLALWDATTSADYLDSYFSRRKVRWLVPLGWSLGFINDHTLWADPTVVQCADAICFAVSIVGALPCARSSLSFDVIWILLSTGNLMATLYAWTAGYAGPHTGDLDWLLGMVGSNQLSLVLFSIAVGIQFTLLGLSLLVWVVLVYAFAPSIWAALFAGVLAACLVGLAMHTDKLCSEAFAAHRANEILLEYSSNGFCAIDIASGTVRSASDEVARLFALPSVAGRPVDNFVSKPDQERLLRLVRDRGRPMEVVNCVDEVKGEVFDCKMVRYMTSAKMAWLALQVVGERRAVEIAVPAGGKFGRDFAVLGAPIGAAPDAADPSGQGGADDAESVDDARSSIAETTATGRMFPNLAEPAHLIDTRGIVDLCIREHCLIPTEDIELGPCEIASGKAWQVKPGSWKGTPIAAKQSKASFGRMSAGEVIMNELRMLRLVRHPCLVQFFGVIVSPSTNAISLIVESTQAPDLCAYLRSPSGVATGPTPGESERARVLLQICWVMRHLHTHRPPIVHGSLKDTNVVVTRGSPYPKVKVLDFGCAQMRTRSQTRVRDSSSWRYRAPELWQEGDPLAPTPTMDIFALGGLMFLLASDTKPFSMITSDDVFFAVRLNRPVHPNWEDQKFTQGFWLDLPRSCMQHNPRDRPHIRHVQACVENTMAEA